MTRTQRVRASYTNPGISAAVSASSGARARGGRRKLREPPAALLRPALGSVRALEVRDVRREGAAAVVPGPGPGLPGCVHHQHDHVLQGRPGFLRPHPQAQTRSHVSIYEDGAAGGKLRNRSGSERNQPVWGTRGAPIYGFVASLVTKRDKVLARSEGKPGADYGVSPPADSN